MKLKKTYTAFELAGDWWWDEDYQAATKRTRWDSARMTGRGNSIRLMRLDKEKECAVRRYVPMATVMRLVRK